MTWDAVPDPSKATAKPRNGQRVNVPNAFLASPLCTPPFLLKLLHLLPSSRFVLVPRTAVFGNGVRQPVTGTATFSNFNTENRESKSLKGMKGFIPILVSTGGTCRQAAVPLPM